MFWLYLIRPDNSARDLFLHKKTGVLIGGSGLIGGTLLHYFKSKAKGEITMLASNSKKLTLRRPDDIRIYVTTFKPDFIINSAIASIDSTPQLAYEINYMGAVFLAKGALELNIPYIHISSAATMPNGQNLVEEDQRPLQPDPKGGHALLFRHSEATPVRRTCP